MSPSVLDRAGTVLSRGARLTRLAAAGFALARAGEKVDDAAPAAPSAVAGGLISEDYQRQNQKLHVNAAGFGVMARYHVPEVRVLARVVSRDILDYGCGKRLLEQGLGFPIANYDPGIPGLEAPPAPADVVVCLDVLEHIEPGKVDALLDDLRRVTRKAGYLTVATVPATKTLPDGRNAHLIVESPDWWDERLAQRFDVRLRFDSPDHATFLVGPRAS